MKRLLVFLLASTFARVIAFSADDVGLAAQPVAGPPQPNVRIELQVVAIPEQIGFPLAAEMKQKEKIEAANTRIQELLAKGTAKLIGWPIIITRSGQRAVSEGIKEIRYADEYEPPTVSVAPNFGGDPAPRPAPGPAAPGAADNPSPPTPPVPPAEPIIKIAPTVDVTTFEGVPTGFQTRNTGVTLEVEPTLSADGKTIELNLVPEHTRLKGFNKVTIEGAARKGKVVVEQPEFHTNKITTSLTLRNGERVLMGVYPTDDPPKHLEFFILKAEALPVE
jgi:hypothetical protein